MKDLQQMFISESNTIIEALNTMNSNRTGTAIVIDESRRLLGTLTDGDVRRALIENIALSAPIKNIYNRECRYVHQEYSLEKVKEIFKLYIKVIPVVDQNNIVTDYVELKDVIGDHHEKENAVLIMAGGLGSRLSPLTDDIPKPMLKIGNRPILQTIIEQFRECGYNNILISVNYKADMIENYFRNGEDFDVKITYIREEKRMGTAGAIKLAKDYLDRPFFVINGDILTNINFEGLMKYHLCSSAQMTIGSRMYETQVPYGVIDVENSCIVSIKEKPIYRYIVNGGIYALNPDVVQYIPDNKQYDMNQLIEAVLLQNQCIGTFPIEGYWMDIGKMEDYYKANVDIKKYF